jgi:hypothetical protein
MNFGNIRKSLIVKDLRGGAGPGPASRWYSSTYMIALIATPETVSNIFWNHPILFAMK